MWKIIRLILLCSPILIAGMIFRSENKFFNDQFNPYKRIKNSKKEEIKLRPKINGKWIIGKGPIADHDSMSLEVALNNATDGDQIYIRPGEYLISHIPTNKNLTLRGLTSKIKEVLIIVRNNKKSTDASKKIDLIIENLTIKDSEETAFAKENLISSAKAHIQLHKINITSKYHSRIFSLSGTSTLDISESLISGAKTGIAIYLEETSKLKIQQSKLIKHHVAIDSNPNMYRGNITISNTSFLNSRSSAIILYGGSISGRSIKIRHNMAGIILRKKAQANLKDVVISNNHLNGIDIGEGTSIHLDNFKIENNKESALLASGSDNYVHTVNGVISYNQIGLNLNNSRVEVTNTEISNNTFGVYSKNKSNVLLDRVSFLDNHEKIQNVANDSKITSKKKL